MLPDGCDIGNSPPLWRNAHDITSAGVIMPGIHSAFYQHEGLRRNYARDFLHFLEDRAPVVNLEIFTVAQHANIRAANENLLTKVPLQTVHDAND